MTVNTKSPTPIPTSFVQLFRFGLIGIVLNIFWYSAYLLITWLGGEPKAVMSVLYVPAVLSSYWANQKFTFAYIGYKGGSLFRYFVAYLIGYLVNLAGLFVGYNVLGYSHQFVQAALIFLVAGVLFILQKFWVFKENHHERRESRL